MSLGNKSMKSNTAIIGVVFLSASVLAAERSPLTKPRAGPFSIAVNEHGQPGELEGPNGKVLPVTAGTGEVRYGALRRSLNQPAEVYRAADHVTVKYRLPGEPAIQVDVTYRLQAERDEAVLTREVIVRASGRLKGDLTVALPNWPGTLPSNTWLPLLNGTPGELGTAVAGCSFQGPLPVGNTNIACPMVTYQDAGGGRVTLASDPYFSTAFAEVFLSLFEFVKTKNRENGCQCYLTDQNLFQFFKKCDNEMAEQCREVGCQSCSGVLHRSDYKRKPRGGPPSDQPPPDVYRDSFCCDQEGCRKRHTPPSIRFLGRKVYWSVAVILSTALRHGINDHRLQILRGHLQIDWRTLKRWRQWWLDTFVKSEFWKSARARFTPLLCEATLPLSLCEAFGIKSEDHLLKLLQFLGPMTTPSAPWSRAF